MSLEKSVEFIRKQKNFLIASHTSMEGDALGSEMAFYRLVKKLGKDATVLNDDVIPYGYDFLPGLSVIRRFKKGIKNIKFDCFVALDCSDLRRTGEVYTVNSDGLPILNIDHHISNSRFADVNWVDPRASCCCEMIYRLYKKLNVPVDRDVALYLYIGILTDTGSFRYSNTTSETHRVAAELLQHGIAVPEVYKNVYGNIPYPDLKVLSEILPRMKVEQKGRLAWFAINREVFAKKKKLSFDLSESLLTFARTLKDVEAVLVFKENLGLHKDVRVNFRSQGKIDVNRIANFFGGGGHKTASGATIKGSLETVKKKVLKKVREALR
jgi:phosphoesterase RecJ-like protein